MRSSCPEEEWRAALARHCPGAPRACAPHAHAHAPDDGRAYDAIFLPCQTGEQGACIAGPTQMIHS